MILTNVSPYSEELLEYLNARHDGQDFGYGLEILSVQRAVFRMATTEECDTIVVYMRGSVPDCRTYREQNKDSNYILFGTVKLGDLSSIYFDNMYKVIHTNPQKIHTV